ncbi:MAG: DNA-binding response regulator [Pimelobacter sp.]|nr:DNA-binding response regulator [Pimelobacter sp.]
MARVLVVDDDTQLTRALTSALQREGFESAVASDATSGVEQLAIAEPDVVVLDLRLPDEDGVAVVRRLRTWSDVPVLILSGVSDQRRRVEALDAGADDFLQKPFGIEELVARLRALLRRSAGAAEQRSSVLTYDTLTVDLGARLVLVDRDEARLTPKEWRLLEVFVSHPGRLLTHTWLLGEVWDDGYGDETRAALRAHIRTLRAKLGDDATNPRYLRTDSGSGYRWIAEEVASAGPAPDAGAAAEAGDADEARIGALGTGEVTHELNNALTALHMAVRLMRPETGSDDESPATVMARRADEILARVSRLAVELERRSSS